MSRRTTEWESAILQEIQDYPLRERVQAIYEVAWRRRVLLEKLDLRVATAAREILDESIESEQAQEGRVEDIDRDAMQCIVAELLAYAQLELSEEDFEHVAKIAIALAAHDLELGHIVQHARCLWALVEMDFDSLRQSQEQWSTDHGDPFWKVRKASLLLESGVDAGVRDLVRQAIVGLRNRGLAARDIASISSREAWASLFMDNLEDKVMKRHRERRGADLAACARYNCDVWNEIVI